MNEYESPEETPESAAEQDMEESFAFNSGSTDGTSLDKEEGVNESQDFLFEGLRFFGSFKGFAEQGLDFAADLAAPYDAEFQDVPQMGHSYLSSWDPLRLPWEGLPIFTRRVCWLLIVVKST